MKKTELTKENKNTKDNHKVVIKYETVLYTVLTYLKTTRRRHHSCDDAHYNCPKHIEEAEFNDDFENAKCDCGADDFNAKLDKQILMIEDALNGV